MSSDRAPRWRARWPGYVLLAGVLMVAAHASSEPARGAVPGDHAVPARGGMLRLDPARTRIAFRLAGTLHETHGTFRLTQGTLALDPTGAASGTIVVDAASGDSANASRDDRMKRVVLETDRYPDIRFQPTHVDGALGGDGAFHATLHGALILHGAAHEIAIEADGRLVGDEVTATSRFTVPYVAWGLTDPSVLLLGVAKDVELEVETAGRVSWSAAT